MSPARRDGVVPAAAGREAFISSTHLRRAGMAALVAAILALGFNLRGSIASLPPLFPELSRVLHLSAAELSALGAVPALCFGLFSPVAAPLSRRFGEERVLGAALIVRSEEHTSELQSPCNLGCRLLL